MKYFKVRMQEILEQKDRYVILDTETTGLDENAEILDIGIIDLDGNILFESLIKPVDTIPKALTDIHGITNEMVANAPTFSQVWPEIKKIIENKTIIIYNAEYDIKIIKQTLKKYGINEPKIGKNQYCIMRDIADAYYDGKWQKLSIFSPIEQEHRAISDCHIVLKGIIKAYA